MNSFLRNMIARARAEGDPVRPRVPSMFEPPTPAAATLDERSVEIPAAPSRFESATQEPLERWARAAATPQPAGMAVPPATPGLRSSTPEEPSPARIFGPQEGSVADTRVERVIERTVVLSQVHPAEVRAVADSREADSLPAGRGLRASSTVQPKMAGTSSVPKPPETDFPMRSVGLAQPHPPVARRVQGRRPLRETPRPEPESTTVHVTIGRIEVRAAHEPPPGRPRSAQTVPVMSLDDYLKTRNRS